MDGSRLRCSESDSYKTPQALCRHLVPAGTVAVGSSSSSITGAGAGAGSRAGIFVGPDGRDTAAGDVMSSFDGAFALAAVGFGGASVLGGSSVWAASWHPYLSELNHSAFATCNRHMAHRKRHELVKV